MARDRAELWLHLDTLLLERALDDLGTELGRREDFAFAALRTLLDYLAVPTIGTSST